MLGLINDCAEQLVITKFGLDAWHAIKEAANCPIKDYGFEQHGHYPDSATVDIVVAASKALNVTVDDVLELFGQFFLQYTIDKGYDNLLRCQGSTLRLWLSNLNAMHDHLQSSMPAGSFPVFWCENCETEKGSIILHYYSVRGALLGGVVVGITKEVAKTYFDVEVDMIKLNTQGEEGSDCTTWRITATDPKKKHKLTMETKDDSSVVMETMNRRHNRRATLQSSNLSGGRNSSHGENYNGSSGMSTSSSVTSSSVSFALDPLKQQHPQCPFSSLSGASQSYWYEPSSAGSISSSIHSGDNNIMNGNRRDEQLQELGQAKMLARAVSTESLQKLAQEHKTKKTNTKDTKNGMIMNGGMNKIKSAKHRRATSASAECHYTKPVTFKMIPENGRGRRWSAPDDDNIDEDDWGVGTGWEGQSSMYCPYTPKEKVKSKKKDKRRASTDVINPAYQFGLTSSRVRSIFPYHVMVDENFMIVQVGNALPEMLLRDYEELVCLHVEKVLKINKPILAGFEWNTLQRLADQKFFLTPVPFDDPMTGARIEASDIKFKGNIIKMTQGGAMFVLSPDAENITELNRMGLTMSDLPLHSFQRDVVFLGEHIASEVRTAHKLDRLSKRLEREKNLSNTLLNSMLPAPVAESMRAGKTVEPRLYENVTLFFSDVVGFTSICDEVEPWDVIDMLNQLYTVMDHLASHFNLYKVETIGDAYMCCSGMPTPDENHAQNIANFALAVIECVHLVKSPADGKPIELRVGVHTGHCMGGVVGTLTPHYCLFGDMVNTTSRHESTGAAGKIQCSSTLYEHLAEHSANSQGPMYDFTARGFVEMKGKGRSYTYWLDNGTKYNKEANPEKIKELQEQVKTVLSKKKWFKRRYFGFSRRRSSQGSFDHHSGHLIGADDSSLAAPSIGDLFGLDGESVATGEVTSTQDDTQGQTDATTATSNSKSSIAEASEHDTDSFTALKRQRWCEIEWKGARSRTDMVAATHGLLSSMLWKCVAHVDKQLPPNQDQLDHDLHRFVDKVSILYQNHAFHNWDHACQVVLSATFLIKEYHKGKDDIDVSVESNPFVRFITVFAALIHDVKHNGMPNAQLLKDDHCLCSVYKSSYLERQSIQIGLGIFIEDFPDLSTFVLQRCPEFLHLVTSSVLATDVSSQKRQKKIQDRFERVVITSDEGLSEFEKTLCVVEQLLLLADVGHCSQSYEIFLNWNAAFFKECLDNFWSGHGDDPRQGWYNGQIGFIQGYILPLAERCSTLVPHSGVAEGARDIVRKWKETGEQFTQQIVRQVELEDQQRRFYDDYLLSVGEGIPTEDTSAKMNGEAKKRKSSKKILKRLLPGHRKESRNSASGSANTKNQDAKQDVPVAPKRGPPQRLSSSVSIASASSNYVPTRNSQSSKLNGESTNKLHGESTNKLHGESMNNLQDDCISEISENDLEQKNPAPTTEGSWRRPRLFRGASQVSQESVGYQSFIAYLKENPGKSSIEEPPESARPMVEHEDSLGYESFLEFLGTKDDSASQ